MVTDLGFDISGYATEESIIIQQTGVNAGNESSLTKILKILEARDNPDFNYKAYMMEIYKICNLVNNHNRISGIQVVDKAFTLVQQEFVDNVKKNWLHIEDETKTQLELEDLYEKVVEYIPLQYMNRILGDFLF
jgi:hypothetical protein